MQVSPPLMQLVGKERHYFFFKVSEVEQKLEILPGIKRSP